MSSLKEIHQELGQLWPMQNKYPRMHSEFPILGANRLLFVNYFDLRDYMKKMKHARNYNFIGEKTWKNH